MDRIQVDSLVCHGVDCINGTRILVSVVSYALSEGHLVDSVLSWDPALIANVSCLGPVAHLFAEVPLEAVQR